MSQEHEFPKAVRLDLRPLQTALAQAMPNTEGEFLAQVMGDMDARARDLAEITRRLIQPGLGQQELRELLLAFQLTSDSLQTSADVLGGKLFEIADSLAASSSKALGA